MTRRSNDRCCSLLPLAAHEQVPATIVTGTCACAVLNLASFAVVKNHLGLVHSASSGVTTVTDGIEG